MIISAFGFLIGWFQQNPTYIFNWFVLQELGILLGGSLTVKNWWGALTGDDGFNLVEFIEVHRYGHKFKAKINSSFF